MSSVFLNILFLFKNSIQDTTSCLAGKSLDDSVLWQFLRLSLFMMTLTVLRNTTRAFYGVSLLVDLSDVFLRAELGFGALEGRTSEMKDHSHHITSRVHADNMIYSWGCWPQWPSAHSVCQVGNGLRFNRLLFLIQRGFGGEVCDVWSWLRECKLLILVLPSISCVTLLLQVAAVIYRV